MKAVFFYFIYLIFRSSSCLKTKTAEIYCLLSGVRHNTFYENYSMHKWLATRLYVREERERERNVAHVHNLACKL